MILLPDATDEALMLQAAAGRTAPLAPLYDRHHRKLFAFFVKLGHGRAAGEDLVQETFLRMLRHAASFRADGRFVPWMYRIARNAAADAWRARPREELLDGDLLDGFAADEQQGPASAHSLADTERRLQRALLLLPRDKRELILLSRVRQLGTDDLARLFGCSTTAVKVRLHRGLGELRELFDSLDQDRSGQRQAEL